MPIELRYHQVKVLPLGGKLHAAVRCKVCSHKKNLFEPLGKDKIPEWEKRAICSKCNARDFSIDIFEIANEVGVQVKTAKEKRCIVCDEVISESTLQAVPKTKCCSKHLDSNPTVIPKLDEPLGTREDFKKDSASNWVRSRSNKL